MSRFYLRASSLVLLFCCGAFAKKHLNEKPAFITPCDWESGNFNDCMAKNYQGLFTEWKDGVPGLKSVGSIDPLEIKRVQLSQDDNNLVSLNADLTHMFVKGASNIKVKSANVKRTSYDVELDVPKLRFDTDYKLNGRILQLPVTGEGKGYFITENSIMRVKGDFKVIEADGIQFVEVLTMQVKIEDIKNFHVQLDNLFDGQKELGDAANALFNENWRDLIHVLLPALEQTIEAVLKDRFVKVFRYVPATYFFTDY